MIIGKHYISIKVMSLLNATSDPKLCENFKLSPMNTESTKLITAYPSTELFAIIEGLLLNFIVELYAA